MAPPNEHATMYTTMMCLKEPINALGSEEAPIVFCMVLLTKALEVLWANQNKLKVVILLEGVMHLVVSYTSEIGVLYGETGLHAMLYESNMFAAGSVQHILSGKDFGFYALKVVEEALTSPLMVNFTKSCEKNGQTNKERICDTTQQ